MLADVGSSFVTNAMGRRQLVVLTGLGISHFGVGWECRIRLLLDDVCEEVVKLLCLFVRLCDDGCVMLRRKGRGIGIAGGTR